MHRHTTAQRYVQFIMTFTAGLWLFASAAFGQQATGGNIFGHVTDKSGGSLPGVTITATGQAAPVTTVTDSQGNFRFLNLSPGKYLVRGELEGFGKTQRQVDVAVGANSEMNLRLDPAVAETITVSAASPVIDRRQVSTGASIEQIELREVPTARDPWVMLQSVPGVLVDRVNVGGNKSGQQSYFVSKGSERTQTVWNIDGVTSTDMSASGGAAGFYLDFDSFQEFRVTTGSSDPAVQTPGVQLNLVTKRGTNDYKGSARFFWTGKRLQADPNVPPEGATYPTPLTVANSINQISEYGAEFGGPIINDRVWAWGSYSKNPINTVVAGNSVQFQKTDLWNYNAKFNGQITPQNAGFLAYMYSNKTVLHRDIGPSRPIETSRNQNGPGWQYTLEDTQNFSPTLFATGRVGRIVNGYHLTPVGGREAQKSVDASGIPHGSYQAFDQTMPQKQLNIDASKFFNAAPMNHELKFGFGYRNTPVASATTYPGDQVVARFDFGEAQITRAAKPDYGSNYRNLYAGDTITAGNLTLAVGARYDIQRAKNNASTVEANGLFPDLMPAGVFAGDTKSLEWKSVTPRLAATYAIGSSKRTLARASYARYADQISAGAVGPNNPFYNVQVLWYYWVDTNKNARVDRGELTTFDTTTNFDRNDRASGRSTGRVDYGMKPPKTDEYVLGLEREIAPAFAVGVDYTYRKRTDLIWTVFEKTRGAGDLYTAADYQLSTSTRVPNQTGSLPNGQGYNIPIYVLKTGVPAPLWSVTTNRPDYDITYSGFELTATKRMQNNWMLRGNVTFSDWKQHMGPNGVPNGQPTPILSGAGCITCQGSQLYASAGGTNGYINSRWAGSLNGVYQFPYQMSFGLAVTMREGYVIPYYRSLNTRDGYGSQRIMVTDRFDQFRLPSLRNVDLRFAKTFSLIRGAGIELSADLFNATNEQTVLWRDYQLRNSAGTTFSGGQNTIQEMQSPRIWRMGARVTF